jgi:uncharacterized DUF497 family protein
MNEYTVFLTWDDEAQVWYCTSEDIGKVGSVYFVVYTECGTDKRIITARPADKSERRSYNGYYQIDGKGWGKAT